MTTNHTERRTPALRPMADVIEEYARHPGHADLVREGVVGLVDVGAPLGD